MKMMMKTLRRPASSEPACILRWVFHRGADALTCAVEAGGHASYDVCVLPHWNLSEATVEHFDAPAAPSGGTRKSPRDFVRPDGWPSTVPAIRRASRRDRSDER